MNPDRSASSWADTKSSASAQLGLFIRLESRVRWHSSYQQQRVAGPRAT